MENAVSAPSSRIRTIVYCALSVALITVSAWITIPFGPIPFTLQTLTILFVLFALKPNQVLITLSAYLLLGAIGLPVFSSFRGGIAALIGPTGGFLLGFLVGAVCALALGYALSKTKLFNVDKKVSFFGAQLSAGRLGRNVLMGITFIFFQDLFGWLWLMVMGNLTPEVAFLTAVAPFIVIDLAKMVVAILLAQAVGNNLARN